jgi:hypothetical protein
MERAKIWPVLIALCVLVAVIAASQMVVNWHQHELKIGSYLDCLMKYDLAKRQGKVPSDPKPPSGSEVCGHLNS